MAKNKPRSIQIASKFNGPQLFVLGFFALLAGIWVITQTFASSYIVKYQENTTSIKHGCGARTTFTAVNTLGKTATYYVWKSPACSNGSHAWYGPYASVYQGDYWACFLVGFDKSVDFTIDVTKDKGASVLPGVTNRDVPARRRITSSPNGEWKQYCLSYGVGSAGAKNVEYRVKNNGTNPVYVDAIEIYHYGSGYPPY